MTKPKPATRTAAKTQIEAGAFSGRYLIYNRKSTDEADSQKNSIEYQKRENARYAKAQGLPVASVSLDGFCAGGVISERHSGFKERNDLSFSKDGLVQYRIERPKFQQMVQLLNDGRFKGVICLCWDRMSRNRGDDTVIRKLMRNGVDVRFVYANYDKSSAGELHMDIDGMFAQHHSRVTSEKVTLSTRANRQKGKCTYRAPIGYLNPGNMDHKPFDPERAPIIQEMFKRYAAGTWSLSDLARFANEQGMTTVPMRRRRTREEMLQDDPVELPKVGRPITENHVSRILGNPFYVGKVLGEDGQYIVSSSHEPLVGAAVFAEVQRALKRKTVSAHYAEHADLPFRGFVRCAKCGRAYSPYLKKGHVYFGARCAYGCDNGLRSCNFDRLTSVVQSLLHGLRFTHQELSELERRIETDKSILKARQQEALACHTRATARIREDLAYLRENRLMLLKSGVYTPDAFVAEEMALEAKLGENNTEHLIAAEEYEQAIREVFNVSELLESLISGYEMADPRKKEQISRIVIVELRLAENTLEFKAQKRFQCALRREYALGDPIAWISELRDQ
ncbi:MAG: recombinase family protein [Nitratireductor sp.]